MYTSSMTYTRKRKRTQVTLDSILVERLLSRGERLPGVGRNLSRMLDVAMASYLGRTPQATPPPTTSTREAGCERGAHIHHG
jgi:hypothetical protein